MVRSLGTPLKAGASGALDLGIRYRLLGLLGALSGKQILALSTTASEAQMAHIISEKVALLQLGIDRKALQDKVSKELKQLERQAGVREPTGNRNARQKKVFNWYLMYDADVGKALTVDHRGKLNSNAPLLLSQDELRRVVAQRQATLPRLANLDVGVGVVGGVLDGWNAYMAVQLVDKEGVTAKAGVNLTAAAFSLAGAGAELAGTVWSKYPFGKLRLAESWKLFGGRIIIDVKLLKFVGRVLAASGGLFTALFDVMTALDARENGDFPVFVLRLSVGIIGGVASLAILFGVMTVGIGFVVFLILAGLSLLGEWLIGLIREDKVEGWLGQTPFGTNEANLFESLASQEEAWIKITKMDSGGV